ncbi:hypothetical protein AUEXF2481DRAFT_666296 [Aureobasidium subglaciale EXF-2481]|uniref:Uncharacterized protein n=1 Tax=Aureobasidium subglaciale (strain EXF-2481) TaxID=1043005 RepID=A0A074YEF5_AURSE|nr:uncharacterized protein AUEXF2481DRAFT_666296 [Aureobasidium subglaciale EXF-2481]KEQ96168.1 hypothetical protein AUEXF2481DRAFT_666296 [Aureobasidium subglaciale EXF-2481]
MSRSAPLHFPVVIIQSIQFIQQKRVTQEAAPTITSESCSCACLYTLLLALHSVSYPPTKHVCCMHSTHLSFDNSCMRLPALPRDRATTKYSPSQCILMSRGDAWWIGEYEALVVPMPCLRRQETLAAVKTKEVNDTKTVRGFRILSRHHPCF